MQAVPKFKTFMLNNFVEVIKLPLLIVQLRGGCQIVGKMVDLGLELQAEYQATTPIRNLWIKHSIKLMDQQTFFCLYLVDNFLKNHQFSHVVFFKSLSTLKTHKNSENITLVFIFHWCWTNHMLFLSPRDVIHVNAYFYTAKSISYSSSEMHPKYNIQAVHHLGSICFWSFGNLPSLERLGNAPYIIHLSKNGSICCCSVHFWVTRKKDKSARLPNFSVLFS